MVGSFFFYSKYFEEIKNFVLNLPGDAVSIKECKKVLAKEDLHNQLQFIQTNFEKIPPCIKFLQGQNIKLSISFNKIEGLFEELKMSKAPIMDKLKKKIDAVVSRNKGYKVYFDNYFTSLHLLSHLSENNICATGTVRENRTGRCPFSNKNWWKTQDRGTYKFRAKDDTLLVQWKDNKVVTVASNFENDDIVNTTRWCTTSKSKKRIPQPKLIANYNKRMGGVDKMDGLIALYRSRIRQRKWYWPIFAYLLDASISNAWLLMKKLNPADLNCASLLNFRRYVALGFLNTYGKKPSRGKTAMPSINPSKFDNVGHMIR
jgi:hypothetical protein